MIQIIRNNPLADMLGWNDPLPLETAPAPTPLLLLTEEQAAQQVGVSRKQISKLIKSGRLEAADYGTKGKHLYRIKPEALAALSAPQKLTPTQPRHRRRRRCSVATSGVRQWLPRVD
jgi:excisionase family DNA binding protein